MSEEKAVLVLSPTEEHKWVEDAVEVTAGCGHQCWLSPGSAETFLNPDIDSKCTVCVGGDPALVQMILEGKGKAADRDEVIRYLKKALGLK